MTVTLELNQDQLDLISAALAAHANTLKSTAQSFRMNVYCKLTQSSTLLEAYLRELEQVEAIQDQILLAQKLDDVLAQKFGEAFKDLGFK